MKRSSSTRKDGFKLSVMSRLAVGFRTEFSFSMNHIYLMNYYFVHSSSLGPTYSLNINSFFLSFFPSFFIVFMSDIVQPASAHSCRSVTWLSSSQNPVRSSYLQHQVSPPVKGESAHRPEADGQQARPAGPTVAEDHGPVRGGQRKEQEASGALLQQQPGGGEHRQAVRGGTQHWG